MSSIVELQQMPFDWILKDSKQEVHTYLLVSASLALPLLVHGHGESGRANLKHVSQYWGTLPLASHSQVAQHHT